MTQRELVLACMAAAKGRPYQPVQIQKMLFILQKELKEHVGEPFEFAAYDYGPFAPEVYSTLDSLAQEGLTEQVGDVGGPRRKYIGTLDGVKAGNAIINEGLTKEAKDYIVGLAEWVRSQSFRQLILAVYATYPEMARNSVLYRR